MLAVAIYSNFGLTLAIAAGAIIVAFNIMMSKVVVQLMKATKRTALCTCNQKEVE